MVEDQMTATAFARGLLDPGLSPREFSPGPFTGRTTAWLGSGDALRQFGLRGGAEVSEHDLAAVVGGGHTGSGLRVLPELSSYDLVFLAPRSVSFTWSQLDAAGKTEIEEAVRASAATMMAHLIRVAPLVDGLHPPRSFVAAQVLHAIGTRSDELGPIPPVLHAHNCLFAVQDEDGTLLTPHEPTLCEEDVQRECDAVAEADLAHRLVMLGYRVRNTAGAAHSFELEGVPRAIVEDEGFWRNTGCAIMAG